MDNGWSYSVFTGFAGQDLATDSNSLKITMGDMGTFSFDQGVGIAGINTLKNEVPTAYEEAGHGVSGSGNSLNGAGNTSVLGYASPSYGGLSLSIAYHPSVSSTSAQAGGVSGAALGFKNLAFGKVVVICSCLIKAFDKFINKAFLWELVLFNLYFKTLCLIIIINYHSKNSRYLI